MKWSFIERPINKFKNNKNHRGAMLRCQVLPTPRKVEETTPTTAAAYFDYTIHHHTVLSLSFFQFMYLLLLISLSSLLPIALCSVPQTQQEVNRQLCHNLCHCAERTVDCNHQDNLHFLPTSIDRTRYELLHVTRAAFINRGLSRLNFSSIYFLTSLKIIYSQLEYIENDTFSEMTQLKYLDLSSNNLRRIENRAFRGLRLTTFFLERNHPNLKIQKSMFRGLRVETLSLVGNNIRQLSYETFSAMDIRILKLFNNSIQTIDKRFKNIFNKPENLLDLTGNPLYCSCGFDWFADMVRRWNGLKTYNVKIKCRNPVYLRERLIQELKKTDFLCEVPSINRISIDIDGRYVQLVCHSTAAANSPPSSSQTAEAPSRNNDASSVSSQSIPRLTWLQIDPKTGKEVSHFEDVRRNSKGISVALNVTNLKPESSFICTASNEVDMSSRVVVNLKLAATYLESFQNILSSSAPEGLNRNKNGRPNKNKNNNNNNVIPPEPLPPHFLFRKQFSILQMIGAVVGTFISVVILILIVYCAKDHVISCHKRHHHSTSGRNNPPYCSFLPQGPPPYHQSPVATLPAKMQQQQQQQQQPSLLVVSSSANSNHHNNNSSNNINNINNNNNNNNIINSNNNYNSNPIMTGSTNSQEYDIVQYEPNSNFLPITSVSSIPPLVANGSGYSHPIHYPHPIIDIKTTPNYLSTVT